MPTTVVKSVGTTGRDYTSWSSWEAALPANLITADQVQRGEGYNDSEFVVAGDVLVISGPVTDATRRIEVTAAAGQSFQDQADIRTHALTYDATRGVALRSTSTYTSGVYIGVDYATVSRLQIKGSHMAFVTFAGAGVATVTDCLGWSTDPSAVDLFSNTTGTATFINCLAIVDAAGDPLHSCFFTGATGTFLACTAIRTKNNGASGNGFRASYATVTMKSCASFGFTTAYSRGSGVSETSIVNNGTDQAAWTGGSSSQLSVSYTSTTPFTQGNAASNDVRSIASTSLAANGVLDATNAPNDISATVRANPPTIGHWELAAAAADVLLGQILL